MIYIFKSENVCNNRLLLQSNSTVMTKNMTCFNVLCSLSIVLYPFDSEKPRGDEPINMYVCMCVCMLLPGFQPPVFLDLISHFCLASL